MKELTSARDAELKVRIEERRMDVTNKSQSSYPKLRRYRQQRWNNTWKRSELLLKSQMPLCYIMWVGKPLFNPWGFKLI